VSDDPPTNTQLFEIRIVATGEVRDKDGNLISQQPIEAVHIATEAEARAIIERQDQP
jgi:hypothetical protein